MHVKSISQSFFYTAYLSITGQPFTPMGQMTYFTRKLTHTQGELYEERHRSQTRDWTQDLRAAVTTLTHAALISVKFCDAYFNILKVVLVKGVHLEIILRANLPTIIVFGGMIVKTPLQKMIQTCIWPLRTPKHYFHWCVFLLFLSVPGASVCFNLPVISNNVLIITLCEATQRPRACLCNFMSV